ncbi:hypothetical protein A3A05_03535 [Candidatus Nomurabacteria bacterium RIFCSPLOWO2_01_FULL_41_12]|uniref:Uncharacterized protein n=1 Tax=Candidatus Nomurabacteria bacterium RIFCSPLOWO2_01_FULL_41_12 TaxID=1801774 RepID=A0A1F6WXM1_9BACT|nr:MAG: hypothetical protein A3A05_03535 [Candidatus Nomurabacteria bacterium RIFCSPLOWO2_01_FULL_41_12]
MVVARPRSAEIQPLWEDLPARATVVPDAPLLPQQQEAQGASVLLLGRGPQVQDRRETPRALAASYPSYGRFVADHPRFVCRWCAVKLSINPRPGLSRRCARAGIRLIQTSVWAPSKPGRTYQNSLQL